MSDEATKQDAIETATKRIEPTTIAVNVGAVEIVPTDGNFGFRLLVDGVEQRYIKSFSLTWESNSLLLLEVKQIVDPRIVRAST